MSFTRIALLSLAVPAMLAAQALPKAETILDRSIEVTGGKATLAAKKSAIIKGTFEMPAAGLKATMTVYRAEPNLTLSEVDIPNMGKIREGFDGKNAWGINPMQGPQVKQGAEKIAAEREAFFHAENWREVYKSVQTQATETVEGEPCYKVLATPHKGEPATHYYSVKTGFLVKVTTKLVTAMGEMPMEMVSKDYKKAGDVLMPHTMVNNAAGQTFTITFTSVEWNKPIEKSTFDAPAEIQALLKK